MTVASILDEAYRRGIELRPDAERNLVLFRPKDAVDDEFLRVIRENKPALIEALQSEQARWDALDRAWTKLEALYLRHGQPRDWMTDRVHRCSAAVEHWWRQAHEDPDADSKFHEALETWFVVCSATIVTAEDRPEDVR